MKRIRQEHVKEEKKKHIVCNTRAHNLLKQAAISLSTTGEYGTLPLSLLRFSLSSLLYIYFPPLFLYHYLITLDPWT
jgi:hypothetical protein